MKSARAAARPASTVRGPRPPALSLRVLRTTRVAVHLAEALLKTAVVLPWVGAPRRHRMIRGWSRRLLQLLQVDFRVHGLPEGGLPGNLLIVANHVSWLDIFVLNTLQPARFVAKADLRRWPVVGWLIAGVGTLFIERDRRRDTHRVNRQMASVLAGGDVVAIFPEGTTTDGRDMLPFKSSLLQPIVEAKGHVQPVAIRYHTHDGELSLAPAYIGDTSFASSFWTVCGARRLVVTLSARPPLSAHASHRRELARAAEISIRMVLESPLIATAPGTRDGPGAAAP